MEWREKDMEGKLSAMIAATEANSKATAKLQSMLEKYMDKGKFRDDGSLSLAIDVMDSPTSAARQHSEGRRAEKIDLESPPPPQSILEEKMDLESPPSPQPVVATNVDLESPPPPQPVVATNVNFESPPPPQPVVAPQTVLESPPAAKVVPEEKAEAEEEGGPKVAADEVESKEEDSEEGDKPAPCAASTGTPTKAKAKKGQAMKNKAEKKSGAPSNDVAADGSSLQVSQVNDAAIQGAKYFLDSTKLVVFNVHGTLLDCSIVSESNPNTEIRPTFRHGNRRFVCRPGMKKFLSRCFLNFEVAFWGSKSARYMEDVVPAMLSRLKDSSKYVPAFV
jgi:hypothetical protein